MTPYYHQSNISTPPPTPRNGNTFPPLKSNFLKHHHNPDHIVKSEAFKEEEEEGKGPFDEDDIELQLSSPSFNSHLELGLKLLRFCSILFLGLVFIGLSIHITNCLYQTPHELIQVYSGMPHITSENRAPSGFKYDIIRHTSIHVPTYPPSCNEAECLIHQISGDGAEHIGTATMISTSTSTSTSEPRFTIVDTPTPDSPPICVPPHCYPRPQVQHDQHDKIEVDIMESDVGDQSPPICVPPHCHPHSSSQEDHGNQPDLEEELEKGEHESPPICVPPHCHPREPGETPPICVPPHCYPHPPPGHHHEHHHDHHHGHHHDQHHDHGKEGETTKEEIPPPCFPPHCYPPPLDVNDESPPICVPPHCFPHPQDNGNDQLKEEEQQDSPRICSDDGCTPNTLPGRPVPKCVAPYCYPRKPGHEGDDERQHEHEPDHDHDHEGEYYDQVSDPDHPKYNPPEACHPPHCYPPTPPSHANTEQIESPPICVPPHCYPSNLPGHESKPLPNDESPPICVPPHCYPHSTFEVDDEGRIYAEDQRFTIQTDQERQVEYLNAHPEIVTIQDLTSGLTQEKENEEDDEGRPICMPPICVPPAKSAPIFVPCDGAEEED